MTRSRLMLFPAAIVLLACALSSAQTLPTVNSGHPIRKSAPVSTTDNHSNTSSMDLSRVGGALAAVVGLIVLVRWGAKRFVPGAIAGRSTHALRVIARAGISPRQQLLLVKVGRRLLVVGDSGQRLTCLSEITEPDEVDGLIEELVPQRASRISESIPAPVVRARRQRMSSDQPSQSLFEPDADDESIPIGLSTTRQEIHGLLEKVRGLSRQFRGT